MRGRSKHLSSTVGLGEVIIKGVDTASVASYGGTRRHKPQFAWWNLFLDARTSICKCMYNFDGTKLLILDDN